MKKQNKQKSIIAFFIVALLISSELIILPSFSSAEENPVSLATTLISQLAEHGIKKDSKLSLNLNASAAAADEASKKKTAFETVDAKDKYEIGDDGRVYALVNNDHNVKTRGAELPSKTKEYAGLKDAEKKAEKNFLQKKTEAENAIKEAETREREGRKKWIFQDWVDVVFSSLSAARALWITIGAITNAGKCSIETPIKEYNPEACYSCNSDPYRICTKQRCQILGQCIAIPIQNLTEDELKKIKYSEGTQGYRCVPGKCEDIALVGFTKGNISVTISNGTTLPLRPSWSKTQSAGAIKIDAGTVPFDTRAILVTLKTDQLASCRYIIDKINANFSEMNNFEENDYPQDLFTQQPLPQTAGVLIPGDMTRDETHTIYIKCKNICGVEHNAAYDHNRVIFKLDKKPDQLPPEIVFMDPQNNGIVSSELTRLNATFWLDENGNCAYSTITKNYSYVWQNMTEMPINTWLNDPDYVAGKNTSVIRTKCVINQECESLNQNQCAHCFMDLDLTKGYEEMNWSILPADIQQQIEQSGLYNTTKLFRYSIRCQDNSPQKNKMPEEDTLSYVIMTMPPYTINITKPEQGQKDYDDTPQIEVTSGTRLTQCKYKIYNGSTYPVNPPTWEQMALIDGGEIATIHQGEHNESLEGSNVGKPYTMEVLCRDTWNMEARAHVTFFILKDTEAPKMVRTYHDTSGDYLILETNEESTCAFSYTGCNFNFSQGSMMIGEMQYLHSAYWRDKTFFIKCVDKWDNYPVAPGSPINSTSNPNHDYCTAILKPFDIPLIG